MDAHEIIGRLKTKISQGAATIKDIDSLNSIEECIARYEELLSRAPEEMLDESASAMAPINIENINIYINENKNEK